MTIWPYNPQGLIPMNPVPGISEWDLDKIRHIVQEEVHKALHPEEAQPSATVEVLQDGKLYRGMVYLVEDDEV